MVSFFVDPRVFTHKDEFGTIEFVNPRVIAGVMIADKVTFTRTGPEVGDWIDRIRKIDAAATQEFINKENQ